MLLENQIQKAVAVMMIVAVVIVRMIELDTPTTVIIDEKRRILEK
jgi:hypothetical protein